MTAFFQMLRHRRLLHRAEAASFQMVLARLAVTLYRCERRPTGWIRYFDGPDGVYFVCDMRRRLFGYRGCRMQRIDIAVRWSGECRLYNVCGQCASGGCRGWVTDVPMRQWVRLERKWRWKCGFDRRMLCVRRRTSRYRQRSRHGVSTVWCRTGVYVDGNARCYGSRV